MPTIEAFCLQRVVSAGFDIFEKVYFTEDSRKQLKNLREDFTPSVTDDDAIFKNIVKYCQHLVESYCEMLSLDSNVEQSDYKQAAIAAVCTLIASARNMPNEIRSDFLMCKANYFTQTLGADAKGPRLKQAIESELAIQKAEFTSKHEKLQSKLILADYYLFNSEASDAYFKAGVDLLVQLNMSGIGLCWNEWRKLVKKINTNIEEAFTPSQRETLGSLSFLAGTEDDDDDLSDFPVDDDDWPTAAV